MRRQLHLNLFIHSRGHHEASWRHPAASPLALTDIRYYQDLACRAEAALFDSIFLADQLALGEDVAQAARTWLEPVTVLAAVAVATRRIGMVATASTTYTEPFNLARQFASLDHISNGRVAWNKATAQAFYADLKALAAAEGRVPDQVLILPGLSPMIASTEAPDRGLVHRRRGGRLQHHAAIAADDAGRLKRGGDPAAAAARIVPHGLCGQDAARALRLDVADERFHGSGSSGDVAASHRRASIQRAGRRFRSRAR